jgi:hypothetical protein
MVCEYVVSIRDGLDSLIGPGKSIYIIYPFTSKIIKKFLVDWINYLI